MQIRDSVKNIFITAVVAALVALPVVFSVLRNYGSNASTPIPVYAETDPMRKAIYETTSIFARVEGCRNKFEYAELAAHYALKNQLPPALIASKIAVESTCNPYAVSPAPQGCVGLTQVCVKTWGTVYDFDGDVNLFNPKDNIEVGTEIMAEYIRKHGLRGGVKAYNGIGPQADAYATKVLNLAGLVNTSAVGSK